MRVFIQVLMVFIPLLINAQTPNRATLTLVQERGFNEFDMDLDVQLIGESDDTSRLTGSVQVEVNIIPGIPTTDQLTILNANVRGSDVDLSSGGFFANYSFTSKGLRFSLRSILDPGVVDPETGEFDASQYEITADRGVLEGSAYTLLTGGQEIDFNFADEPFSGVGGGTGKITVTPSRTVGSRVYFNLAVELPLSLDQAIDTEQSPVAADVKIDGIMKAVGETFIEVADYASWAAQQGFPSQSENAFQLWPSASNYHYFALGFSKDSAPDQLFDFSQAGATLKTAGEFALGSLEIQWSEDLKTWSQVPAIAMASGRSAITYLDSLAEPSIVKMDQAKRYLRIIRLDAP